MYSLSVHSCLQPDWGSSMKPTPVDMLLAASEHQLQTCRMVFTSPLRQFHAIAAIACPNLLVFVAHLQLTYPTQLHRRGLRPLVPRAQVTKHGGSQPSPAVSNQSSARLASTTPKPVQYTYYIYVYVNDMCIYIYLCVCACVYIYM